MKAKCGVHGEKDHVEVLADPSNAALKRLIGRNTKEGERVWTCTVCVAALNEDTDSQVELAPEIEEESTPKT